MLTNVFLSMIVYAGTQWLVKPLLAQWLSPSSANQNNMTRLAVALLAVLVVEINHAASGPLTLAIAWSLLPSAAAVAAGAIASYHVLADPGAPAVPAELVPPPGAAVTSAPTSGHLTLIGPGGAYTGATGGVDGQPTISTPPAP